MLRYSVEDLYGVNAIGMVYPRLRPLLPTLILEIDVQGAVRRCDIETILTAETSPQTNTP